MGFAEEPYRPSTAGREARIQTEALPAVGCAYFCVPSMGTVLMGFKSAVDQPDMTKTDS